jgi:DNA-binding NarL/FixJ family response regulator
MRVKQTTVVIVDDHPLFRQGLRQAIAADPRFDIIGETGESDTAIEMILRQKPEIAVLDVALRGMSGLEVAAALRHRKSATRFVILTMLKDEQVFNRALNLGISGYVLKENVEAEILNCIASVADGRSYISPSLTDFLLRRRSRAELLANKRPGVNDLTVAEKRVLKRIAQGKTSKEIAAEFFVSPRTVESHRSNICTKLELTGSNRLLQFALEHRDALSHLD